MPDEFADRAANVVEEAEAIVAELLMRLPLIQRPEHGSRQQRRRLALHPGTCCLCGQTVVGGNTACMYGGRDAHVACAVSRNVELRKLARDFAIQDHRDKGTTCPTIRQTNMAPMRPMTMMVSPRTKASPTPPTGS